MFNLPPHLSNFQVYVSAEDSGTDFEKYSEAKAFIAQEKLNEVDCDISYDEDSGEPVSGWIDCRKV